MSKHQISPLTAIPLKGEGARPEPLPEAPTAPAAKTIPPKEQPDRITMTIRPFRADHALLKRISHETGHPMQRFLDEALAEWFKARGLR